MQQCPSGLPTTANPVIWFGMSDSQIDQPTTKSPAWNNDPTGKIQRTDQRLEILEAGFLAARKGLKLGTEV